MPLLVNRNDIKDNLEYLKGLLDAWNERRGTSHTFQQLLNGEEPDELLSTADCAYALGMVRGCALALGMPTEDLVDVIESED